MNGNGVEIHAHNLLKICRECKEVRASYDREVDVTTYKKWSWRDFKKVDVRCYSPPPWACTHSGIMSRLNSLERMANNISPDERIFLTETTYSNLIKLKNKDKRFQKDVFAMGY